MKMMRRNYFALLLILIAAYPAYSSTYFVSTTGNDTTGDGSIGNPWRTIGKGVSMAAAGDIIYVRAGTYAYTGSSDAISLPIKSGSSETNRCSLIGYNGERPFLDFSAKTGTSADGIQISGSYWFVKGFDCKGAPHNGIQIRGGYNIIEFCSFYENRNTGVQLEAGASYNQIINCDSYYNFDAHNNGEDADGFAPKTDVGTGNYFYGCRAWQNSDDGYDGYLRDSDDVTTTYENCWSFKNGYLKSGAESGGNGNGFKMGGSDDKTLRHNAILKRCLCFQNKAKGYDQNSDKGSMWLYNCTAYDNNSYDFSITSSPLASGKVAEVINCVSFPANYNLSSFVLKIGNSWQPPVTTTIGDFVSTDPSAAYGPRNADGSLPDITFMHLVEGSDLIDHGTTYVGLPYCGSAPDIGCFEVCPAVEQWSLTTSASAGGTVTTPGIGVYSYDDNTYADIVASANVNYHFVNWSGTAVTAGKVTNPGAASTTVLMDADYTVQANFAIDQKTISGFVTEPDANIPMSDVSVDATNGGGSDTTDVYGYYELTVDYGWSGTVIPSKDTYAFEPNSLTYTNVTTDITDQNYVGTLMTFSISGYVENACEIPVANVFVSANNGGGSDTTDDAGFYEVWVDYGWSGTVTPDKANYTFDPNGQTYTNVTADQTEQNYTADNIYDLDCSGYIDFGDVKVISDNWLAIDAGLAGGDFDDNNIVDFIDFADFAGAWQEQ
jgi:hypothetical protein